jgi:hypothetical protein
MLRITSFKARASGRTANAGRERPLTAARVGRGVRSAPRDTPQAPEARTRTSGATARRRGTIYRHRSIGGCDAASFNSPRDGYQ